jgi:hypothetical protein
MLMSEERDGLRKIAVFFLCAGVVFAVSYIACIVIQGLSLDIPQIFGFIAYFGGPLPIYPAVLGSVGVVLLAVSSMMK